MNIVTNVAVTVHLIQILYFFASIFCYALHFQSSYLLRSILEKSPTFSAAHNQIDPMPKFLCAPTDALTRIY
jgi:hypothetical protein